ncbi:MAG TPA: DUF6035 family protein [Accumulibacter sp.]|nr:DUF6035 family protein [Accumulibacter sp.]
MHEAMRPPSGPGPQQTVRLAIDSQTGELVPAEALLAMSEDEFSGLRREAMEARVDRRKGGEAVRYQCAICKFPLYLSRRVSGAQNRWFVHDGKSHECPWYEGNRLAPEQIKALVYRGQQEGREHRELKEYIAHWLSRDPLVSDVNCEQTTFSEVVKGEWRRPDVKCLYGGVKLVFEIQLSYTFLSDVIARDGFYRREKTFVIWVFSKFDRSRAAVTDEAFFNRRNLFVIDADARRHTGERSALTFSGYHQVPTLDDNWQWRDTWQSMPIGMAELKLPTDTWRPYFFDYEARRKQIETERIEASRVEQARQWAAGIAAYREAALRYFASNHGEDERRALVAVVDELEEHTAWHPGFEGLRESRFYGYHGVLAVLLSIQTGKPVSYNSQLSVFQVIEAGLRTASRVGLHAYSILYLWAYKTYRPTMPEKQGKWLIDYARKIKLSFARGELVYRRDTSFDEAIDVLFPELGEHLSSPFGTDLMDDEGAG